jgi:hypothetical protein
MLDIDNLCVDTLCIIQDDDEDKKYQIGKMGSIYNSAFLTIVAASGDDSSAGLPGLRPDTRFYNQEEIVVIPPSEQNGGLSLMTTINTQATNRGEFFIDALEDIDQSKWNNRAWKCKSECFPAATSYPQRSKYCGPARRPTFAKNLDLKYEIPGSNIGSRQDIE